MRMPTCSVTRQALPAPSTMLMPCRRIALSRHEEVRKSHWIEHANSPSGQWGPVLFLVPDSRPRLHRGPSSSILPTRFFSPARVIDHIADANKLDQDPTPPSSSVIVQDKLQLRALPPSNNAPNFPAVHTAIRRHAPKGASHAGLVPKTRLSGTTIAPPTSQRDELSSIN